MYSTEELWESDFQLRNHIIDLFIISNEKNQVRDNSLNFIKFMLQKLNRQQLIDTLIYIQRVLDVE